MTVVIALEGVVHAGKTTLARGLGQLGFASVVGEYVEYATERFPAPPTSATDANQARAYFLALEQTRKGSVISGSIVVLDRSVLSIMAYDFAMERLTGVPSFKGTLSEVISQPWIFPDLCIYLDVDDSEVRRRHERETAYYQPVLLDETFNAFMREFYEQWMPSCFPDMRVERLDASLSVDEVLASSINVLSQHMSLKT